jgi:uncharacterized OB-fold protein
MSFETLTDVKGWTHGGEAILYQTCVTCGAVWYFHRNFCPSCGKTHVAERQASGRGIVHAVTLVARAPSPEMRALAPYLIALIDAEEGFRMMGHGDKSLKIGDAVVGRVVRFADRSLPYFEPQWL